MLCLIGHDYKVNRKVITDKLKNSDGLVGVAVPMMQVLIDKGHTNLVAEAIALSGRNNDSIYPMVSQIYKVSVDRLNSSAPSTRKMSLTDS